MQIPQCVVDLLARYHCDNNGVNMTPKCCVKHLCTFDLLMVSYSTIILSGVGITQYPIAFFKPKFQHSQ